MVAKTAERRWVPLRPRRTRAGLAILGLGPAVVVLVLAPLHPEQSWALILLGVTLASTTVRTVVRPSSLSLATLLSLWLAVILLAQTL